ncbi:MAG: glycoside hydrolase, partial [Phenylobacterium zucineum]
MSANRRAVLALAGLSTLVAAPPAGAASPKSSLPVKPTLRIDPRDLGAAGDGLAKDTHAIQL